ncbi:hypothetical protein [Massilia sp. DD77]|uniref:hypothetical protein n=1 Tax=Massilia sp. DD77 TaxID=3109349 RepID=UPI002FFE5FB0
MPKIQYRIVDTDPTDHQIRVRFFSDVLPESALISGYDESRQPRYRTEYAITLPVPAPQGEELHALILRYCPFDWFDTMHAVKDPNTPTPLPLLAVGSVRDAVLPPHEPTEAEVLAGYEAAVDAHIHAVAQAFGYMSIISAISYADEPAVARFQQEGIALRRFRSECYAKCHEVLADVKAGVRPQPTHAELIAELPPPPVQEPLL